MSIIKEDKDLDLTSSSTACSMDSFDDSPLSRDLGATIADAWRPEKLQAIAARWKLTDREQEQLHELQDRLVDVRHHKNDPEEVVRFLKESGSLKGAERMFRRFIQFRFHHVDTILQDYHPDLVLKSHFPMTLLNGFDKDGDGIWVERPGVTDCYGLYERFGKDELIRYCLWARETACHSSWRHTYVAEKKRAPRMTCIVDLKGLNRSHMRPILLPILAHIVSDIQNYYCGFIKKIIIIREPAIFKVIWNMVKHCFNANMRDLMVFAGSDYESVLGEYIDDLEDNLPSCLFEGGVGTIAEGLPQRMEGGPLPPKSKKSVNWNLSRTTSCPGSTSLSDDEEEEEERPEDSVFSSVSPTSSHRTTSTGIHLEFNPITDRESMAVRCQLLAKGSF